MWNINSYKFEIFPVLFLKYPLSLASWYRWYLKYLVFCVHIVSWPLMLIILVLTWADRSAISGSGCGISGMAGLIRCFRPPPPSPRMKSRRILRMSRCPPLERRRKRKRKGKEDEVSSADLWQCWDGKLYLHVPGIHFFWKTGRTLWAVIFLMHWVRLNHWMIQSKT